MEMQPMRLKNNQIKTALPYLREFNEFIVRHFLNPIRFFILADNTSNFFLDEFHLLLV